MLNPSKNGKPCIYCIKNTVNNKKYIGSAIGHYRRKGQHFYMLRNNKHYNKHLQSSWNKYLEESFKFEILEFINNLETINNREEFFIRLHKSTDPKLGYNHRDKCNTNFGIKWPEESKKKFSESKKGKKISHLNYIEVAKKNNKAVKATNKITLETRNFNSILEASKCLKINRTSISKVLKGVIKSAGNHYWSYQGL